MTSTSTSAEMGDPNCVKTRVLKPPGGGTSDIFNSGNPEPPVRRQRNVPKSSLFLNDDPTPAPKSPAKNSGKDSHSRLFGPPPVQPPTPSKNRMKSNIHFGGPQVTQETNGNSHKSSSDSIDGNPVTGEGYEEKPMVNGAKTNGEAPTMNGGHTNGTTNGTDHAAPLTNGTSGQTNGTNGKARQRIPPGGYSKGFW